MMIFFGDLFELRDVQQLSELIEVEHVFVFAVLAKESHVLTEIHVFEMVCDEAAVTALDAFSEFGEYFLVVFHSKNLRDVIVNGLERRHLCLPRRGF